ncbi:MAG: hypothetical protein LBE95_02305, partial [Holosporaceae bacterium]|nr:hypothetical protein [Holosporaceae bacterium]
MATLISLTEPRFFDRARSSKKKVDYTTARDDFLIPAASFAQLCAECGFDYVFRICENLTIQIDGNSLNLKSFYGQNSKFKA